MGLSSHVMDELLSDEQLRFEPLSGTVDPKQVIDAVMAAAPCFQDPVVPGLFILAEDKETLATYRKDRADRPEGFPPYTLLVQVDRNAVTMVPMNVDGLAGPTRRLIGWMVANIECRVINGHGNVVDLLGEPPGDAGDA